MSRDFYEGVGGVQVQGQSKMSNPEVFLLLFFFVRMRLKNLMSSSHFEEDIWTNLNLIFHNQSLVHLY